MAEQNRNKTHQIENGHRNAIPTTPLSLPKPNVPPLVANVIATKKPQGGDIHTLSAVHTI